MVIVAGHITVDPEHVQKRQSVNLQQGPCHDR
jgi:hypothetical protein